jgi:hypothetical protein
METRQRAIIEVYVGPCASNRPRRHHDSVTACRLMLLLYAVALVDRYYETL